MHRRFLSSLGHTDCHPESSHEPVRPEPPVPSTTEPSRRPSFLDRLAFGGMPTREPPVYSSIPRYKGPPLLIPDPPGVDMKAVIDAKSKLWTFHWKEVSSTYLDRRVVVRRRLDGNEWTDHVTVEYSEWSRATQVWTPPVVWPNIITVQNVQNLPPTDELYRRPLMRMVTNAPPMIARCPSATWCARHFPAWFPDDVSFQGVRPFFVFRHNAQGEKELTEIVLDVLSPDSTAA